jgi:hypothetical protein
VKREEKHESGHALPGEYGCDAGRSDLDPWS